MAMCYWKGASLAKTLAIKSLAQSVKANFSRIQFT